MVWGILALMQDTILTHGRRHPGSSWDHSGTFYGTHVNIMWSHAVHASCTWQTCTINANILIISQRWNVARVLKRPHKKTSVHYCNLLFYLLLLYFNLNFFCILQTNFHLCDSCMTVVSFVLFDRGLTKNTAGFLYSPENIGQRTVWQNILWVWVGHMYCDVRWMSDDIEFSLAWKYVWMQTQVNISTIWKSPFPNPTAKSPHLITHFQFTFYTLLRFSI
jgi:hypothetical protein